MYSRKFITLLLPCVLSFACGDSKSPKLKVVEDVPSAAAVSDASPELLAPVLVTLTSTAGAVEVRRGGSWIPASPGEALGFDDSLRTQDGATADLQLGMVKVVLEPRSEVTVREMSEEVKNLRLDKGVLAAKVQGGGNEKLRVRAAGSSAVAETGEGEFTVFNDGKGLVAVAPSSGEVRLTSKGGDQVLAVGERGLVSDDGAPQVDKVPSAVLLHVNWPSEELARPQEVVVRGSVEATSRVEINGVSIPVNRDGSFAAPVTVKRGKNPVSVMARDFAGGQRTTNSSIMVMPGAPKAHADTKNLWKKK